MRYLIGLIASSITGAIGWWIGAQIGTMTAYLVSTVAGAVGLYYGLKWARDVLP